MNRVKLLRKNRGLSQSELASALNVHQTAISQWETGKTNPDMMQAVQVASFFGVSVDYLLEQTNNPQSAQRKKGIKIPVLGCVQAGIPIEAIEDIVDYEEITEEMAHTGEHFGLVVRGDSMEPRMVAGDVIIVRKQPDCESGETAVVLVNGEDANVKRIKKAPDGIMLISSNPAYEPMYYTNSEIEKLPVQIIGKVVELRGKFL